MWWAPWRINYLKKFLNIFPGVNLLRIVAGSVFELIVFKSSDSCFEWPPPLPAAAKSPGNGGLFPPPFALVGHVVGGFVKSGMLDAFRDDNGTESANLFSDIALPPNAWRRWFCCCWCAWFFVSACSDGNDLNAPNCDRTNSSAALLIVSMCVSRRSECVCVFFFLHQHQMYRERDFSFVYPKVKLKM